MRLELLGDGFRWEPFHRLTAIPLVLSGPLCPFGTSPHPVGRHPFYGGFRERKRPQQGSRVVAFLRLECQDEADPLAWDGFYLDFDFMGIGDALGNGKSQAVAAGMSGTG